MAKSPGQAPAPELPEYGPLWEEMAHRQIVPGIQPPNPNPEHTAVAFTLSILQDMLRGMRNRFDHSHPVDEYQSTTGVPTGGRLDIQPTYDIPERIESILAVIPIGVQAATLQLGDRIFSLLGAAAPTTVATIVSLNGLGIIIGQSDERVLLMSPVPAAGPTHIELMGWADELFGNA